MDQLIKVSKSEGGKDIVSARDLYLYLEVSERFANWFERQLGYGFQENVDFVGCKVFNTLANQELTDFAITISMAKEISMIQRSEKGKLARQYFIACEQALMKPKSPTTYLEAMKEVVRLEEERLALECKIEEDAPKVKAAEELLATGDNITVGEFAKILGTGQNLFFEWLRNHKYLIAIGAKKNLPYQNYLQMGIFDVKETVVGPEGDTRLHSQTFITPKGQVYLTGKYKS